MSETNDWFFGKTSGVEGGGGWLSKVKDFFFADDENYEIEEGVQESIF